MKKVLLFTFLLSIVLCDQFDVFSKLRHRLSTGNCKLLQNFQSKLLQNSQSKLLNSSSIPTLQVISSHRMAILQDIVQDRLKHLNCVNVRRKRQLVSDCPLESIGDGYCDVPCNELQTKWDGGDCCPHTCIKGGPYPCGTGGYQCKARKKIPVWFAANTKLCLRWYADGDPSQCGGGASNHVCAKVNSLTPAYLDNTNDKVGGCRLRWGIETTNSGVPDWFRKVSICYRWFADGEADQCNSGEPAQTFCAAPNFYTTEYRDDTNSRPGGCQMSWRLNIPDDAEYWAKDLAFCYQWYPEADGNMEQCGGGIDRRFCAVANTWTEYYRDNTDKRPGGCRMQWGLQLA